MAEEIRRLEQEVTPLDISERVRAIIEGEVRKESPGRSFDLMDLMREEDIKNAPALTITLPWYSGSNWAKWVKSWLENQEALRKGQRRTAAIICNETQKMMEANVFASGVIWIDSEKINE